jgi:hypothetical protein
MQVDSNYTHKYFYGYIPAIPAYQGEVYPENFSVELTQPLLDCKDK